MTRKDFLKLIALTLGGFTMPLIADKTKRAPAFFVGHGNPMNAIEDNAFTKSLRTLGKSIQTPKAILVISAHWSTPFNAVNIHDSDELMYDMYGFPEELYKVQYSAPNADFLIPDLQKLIPSLNIRTRNLDHGVWSILVHLFPHADISVMQLAINNNFSMQEHFEMGKKIKLLRDNGIMIIGSGNITHNLGDIRAQKDAPVVAWAKEFDGFVKEAIVKKDYTSLINFEQRYAQQAHPTKEHYIPLLYIAGSSYDDDESKFIHENIEHGTISMRNWFLT